MPGKIIFTPTPDFALAFPETKYLELADTAALDVGIGDFSLSFIFYVDPAIDTSVGDKLLVGKGPYNLASQAGWWICYQSTSDFVRVKVNDGNATSVTVNSDNGSISKGYWFWLHCSFNRDGNVNIWLGNFATGALSLIKSGDISSRPGSWSNSNALWMGNWGATATRYFKGNLSYVRLDVGRLLPDAWIEEEWLRVKWGMARKIQDFTACWPFDESLVDLSSAGYTLSYLPSGTPTYVSGVPTASAPLTYSFAQNYSQDYEQGRVPHFEVERAKDGTAYAYGRAVKGRWSLPFRAISPEQLIAFQAAYEGAQPLNLYLEATQPRTGRCFIMEEPAATARPAWRDGKLTYDVTLALEEA